MRGARERQIRATCGPQISRCQVGIKGRDRRCVRRGGGGGAQGESVPPRCRSPWVAHRRLDYSAPVFNLSLKRPLLMSLPYERYAFSCESWLAGW
jgi:hypothetical protein